MGDAMKSKIGFAECRAFRRSQSHLYKVGWYGETMTFIINVCACRDADLSCLEKIMESNLQQQSRFLREDGFFCGSCSRKHFTETEICLQIKPIAEELDGYLLFLPN